MDIKKLMEETLDTLAHHDWCTTCQHRKPAAELKYDEYPLCDRWKEKDDEGVSLCPAIKVNGAVQMATRICLESLKSNVNAEESKN